MALDLTDANAFRAAIRYDPLTKKGSVLDVIQLVTGCGQRNASRELTRITDTYQNILPKMMDVKFEGYKQKPTKAAHLSTLIEIAWLCPGRHAKEFRRTGAVTMCRALGGDLSLVEDIRKRHGETTKEEREAFLAGTGVTAAEANGQAVVPRSPEEERALRLSNEHATLALVKEAGTVAAWMREMVAEEEDARYRLFIEDTAKNLFMRYAQLATGDCDPGAAVTKVRLPLSISGVAAGLGHGKLGQGELTAIGKAAARLYRELHGTGPPKHTQFVDGAARNVNSYTTEDRGLLEEAVRAVLD